MSHLLRKCLINDELNIPKCDYEKTRIKLKIKMFVCFNLDIKKLHYYDISFYGYINICAI